VVLSALLVCSALKVYLATRTYGTTDVRLFTTFADGIREHGPIQIYGREKTPPALPYNHAPLTGWLLVGLNWLTDHGIAPFRVLIRLPAILADVVTTLVVFELVRAYRSVRAATYAAVAVACSPALGMISGFHGNTDPVFVMFTLLSLYLLAVRRLPALAGLSFAIGLSVKLVPIVVLPALLVLAARSGRRRLYTFVACSGAFLALLWVPVLLARWTPFRHNVIGYTGGTPRVWGIVQFGRWAGMSEEWLAHLYGSGRFGLLLIVAGVPAFIVWRRPTAAIPAVSLSLVLLQLLNPSSATQYLAWPAAAAMLVSVPAGIVYNLGAGLYLVHIYNRWNQAWPWHWWEASASGPTPGEIKEGAIVWASLLCVTLVGLWSVRAGRTPPIDGVPVQPMGDEPKAARLAVGAEPYPGRSPEVT
jgi:hypothetical protein